MRTSRASAAFLAFLFAAAPSAWPQDLAAVRQALEARYPLTVTTADKTDIVTPGAVLVLKRSNLVTVDVKSGLPGLNKYANGQISSGGMGKVSWLKSIPGTPWAGAVGESVRTFVTGEKLWLTGIEVKETGIVFTLFTDAYDDKRFQARLAFPFQKGSTPSEAQVMGMVAEVFSIQPSDDGAGQEQASAPGGPPAPQGYAEPKTIGLGQTMAQVTAILGRPNRIIERGITQVYIYKDLRVTFAGGRVSDVE